MTLLPGENYIRTIILILHYKLAVIILIINTFQKVNKTQQSLTVRQFFPSNITGPRFLGLKTTVFEVDNE